MSSSEIESDDKIQTPEGLFVTQVDTIRILSILANHDAALDRYAALEACSTVIEIQSMCVEM